MWMKRRSRQTRWNSQTMHRTNIIIIVIFMCWISFFFIIFVSVLVLRAIPTHFHHRDAQCSIANHFGFVGMMVCSIFAFRWLFMSLILLCLFVYDFAAFLCVRIYMGAHQLCYACVSDSLRLATTRMQNHNEKIMNTLWIVQIWLNSNCIRHYFTLANWTI